MQGATRCACVCVSDRNGPSAYLIARKRFVTLIPSISAFSAERETVNATELKCSLSITRRATSASLLYMGGVSFIEKKNKKRSSR